jgi:hypothetical protein
VQPAAPQVVRPDQWAPRAALVARLARWAQLVVQPAAAKQVDLRAVAHRAARRDPWVARPVVARAARLAVPRTEAALQVAERTVRKAAVVAVAAR